jgi:cysteine-rich repeat protein
MAARALIALLCLLVLVPACSDDEGADSGTDAGNDTGGAGECGDGVLDSDEECDDDNLLSGDGCSVTCELEELCDTEGDEDGDGDADCDDSDCSREPACTGAVEDCATEGDEDGNGDADCDDAACAEDPACQETLVEDCDTEGDEDGNGDADCDDAACADDPACDETPVEDCATEGDEDGNGDADCDDAACADDPACDETPVEDCATEGDEDGNGDADCDDAACADDPACEVADLCGDGNLDDGEPYLEECDEGEETNGDDPNTCRGDCTLPTCGDGIIDDATPFEETCDDGLLNNDRAPNACRESCVLPSCGDGVVDTEYDEECEPNPALDPDEDPCDPISCELRDDTTACGSDLVVYVLGDDDRVGDATDRYRLTFELGSPESFLTAGVECGDDLPESGPEQPFLFVPSTDGTFFARTNLGSTEVDTVLYLRNGACTSGPALCNDDAELSAGSFVQFEAEAGDNVYLVVDSFVGAFGDVTLEIGEITLAAEGEACAPPFVSCDEDLTCIRTTDGRSCEDAAAPTATSIEAIGIDNGDDTFALLFRGVGADTNFDVVSFAGVVGNTDPLLDTPVAFDLAAVRYDEAGGFTTATFLAFDAVEGFETITGRFIDSAELESVEITGDFVVQTTAAEGEACDPPFAVCATGLSCLDDETLGRACAAGVEAPTILEVSTAWLAPDKLVFTASGTDAEPDVAGLSIAFLAPGGAGVVAGPIDFDFSLIEFTFDEETSLYDWSGQVVVFINNPGGFAEAAPRARVRAFDASGNLSGNIATGLAWPNVSDVGGPCDIDQATDVCANTLVCDNVVGEVGECRESRFELLDCFFTADGESIVYVWEQDALAVTDDTEAAGWFLLDTYEGATFTGTPGARFVPAEGESGVFAVTLGGVSAVLTEADTHIFCHLKTDGGRTSSYIRLDRTETRGLGESCIRGTQPFCAPGLACFTAPGADGPTCGYNTAPSIDTVTLTRESLTDASLTIDVSDPDGDLLNAYHVAWQMADGADLIIPRFLSPEEYLDPIVFGTTRSEGQILNIQVPLTPEATYWPLIESVDVRVFDLAGGENIVRVPVNLGDGDACTVGATEVPCADGLTCTGGTCE